MYKYININIYITTLKTVLLSFMDFKITILFYFDVCYLSLFNVNK